MISGMLKVLLRVCRITPAFITSYSTLDLLETSYLGEVIANVMSLACLRSLIAKCQMLFLEIITD